MTGQNALDYQCRHVPATEQHRTLHVLVVDDYPDSALSMAMLLRLYGHEVDTAFCGPAALLAARSHEPDVVLLDIAMPGMSGYEVARRLRAMLHDRLLLIALTAYEIDEDRRHFLDAGFDWYFLKPADPKEVQRLLRDLTI